MTLNKHLRSVVCFVVSTESVTKHRRKRLDIVFGYLIDAVVSTPSYGCVGQDSFLALDSQEPTY